MARDGTPLPAALSGNITERLIRIDEALIYLVNGALEYLCDREPFEQTGALTVETVKTALSAMFQTYFNEEPLVIPIGQITPFGSATIPTKWIKCDGAAISRATYADLFAVIGTNYGAGNGTTTFNLPDLRGRSPYGAGDASVPALGNTAGAVTAALTLINLPSHDHDYADPGHVHTFPRRTTFGAAAPVSAYPGQTATVTDGVVNSSPTGITFHAQGSNIPHANLHPVIGVNFIIYAGI